jgi:hypothetical protein
VIERKLVVTNPKAKDIIREHKAYNIEGAKVRNFNGTVLAYVTPVSNRFFSFKISIFLIKLIIFFVLLVEFSRL